MVYVFLMLLDTPQERDLFTVLYQKYQHFMIYLAYGILHDQALAEDATHDAFLTLTRFMDRVSDPDLPSTRNFLATMVKSRAIDILRKEKKYQIMENIEDMTEDLYSENEEPFEALVRQTEQEMLKQCMEELSEEHRVVLELKYMYDLTGREIADILGISEKNAGMRILRGRRKLRSILESKLSFER